jgi:hypothetical protein
MAVDKLVDSTQLDADLTSVANAIRTKGGTSAQLAFPAGFVSAINDISGGGGGAHNLPSAYEEFEYIEATGTQYINTGYVPNADTEVRYTSERTASQSYDAADWGVTPTPKAQVASMYWGWGSASDKSNPRFNPDSPWGPMTARVDKTGVYNLLGAKVVDFGTVTWTSGVLPIYLFCRNNNGTAERMCKLKIYYWAAFENNTKMIELIPAMRKSDSVLGMYETVSGSFLTNAGTGTFVGGTF